jgi:hypothetical protein
MCFSYLYKQNYPDDRCLSSADALKSRQTTGRRPHIAPARGAAGHRLVVLASLADLEILIAMGDAPGLRDAERAAENTIRSVAPKQAPREI